MVEVVVLVKVHLQMLMLNLEVQVVVETIRQILVLLVINKLEQVLLLQ
tara:strand:+ start:22 stop:165 length:144 start_codon:yes stop_codon:yes gene_type:complete